MWANNIEDNLRLVWVERGRRCVVSLKSSFLGWCEHSKTKTREHDSYKANSGLIAKTSSFLRINQKNWLQSAPFMIFALILAIIWERILKEFLSLVETAKDVKSGGGEREKVESFENLPTTKWLSSGLTSIRSVYGWDRLFGSKVLDRGSFSHDSLHFETKRRKLRHFHSLYRVLISRSFLDIFLEFLFKFVKLPTFIGIWF